MDIPKYILAVDFGSTHGCSRIYTTKLELIGSSTVFIPRLSGANGFCELDPEETWECFCNLLKNVLESTRINLEQIKCLGITVQRNSFLLWDKKSSKPSTRIITWEDSRCIDLVAKHNNSFRLKGLKAFGSLVYRLSHNSRFKALASYRYKTTLACTRLKYVFNEKPTLLSECRRGLLCYGCLETWFLWRLTNGNVFGTDVSCASASGMYDPFCYKWSKPILACLGIPSNVLPTVYPSSYYYGKIQCATLKTQGSEYAIPITGIIGDTQAATLAENCLLRGEAKVTYGTGSFLNLVTGKKAEVLEDEFYPVIGWATDYNQTSDDEKNIKCNESTRELIKFKNLTYLVETHIQNTGALFTWLRSLGMFSSYNEMEELLNEGDRIDLDDKATSDEIYYLFDRKHGVKQCASITENKEDSQEKFIHGANGLLVGVSKSNLHENRSIILRVVLESIAFITKQMLEKCKKEIEPFPEKIHVNGSVAKSDWIMQRLANVICIPVIRSNVEESSCMGAAIVAGVGAGVWPDLSTALQHLPGSMSNGYSSQNSAYTSKCFYPQQDCLKLLNRRYHVWSQLQQIYFT